MRVKATLAAVLALALLSLGAGSAQAANIFSYEKSFDGSSTEPGQFGSLSPHGMAINQTTGDVYALDIQHGLVDIFDSEGVYQGKIDGSATPAKSLSLLEPSAVAVDNSGAATNGYVYVADSSHNVIVIFDGAGAYLGQLTGSTAPGGSLSAPAGVAVDDSGSVYVSDSGNQRILKYASSSGPVDDGDYVSALTDPEHLTYPTSIALDGDENLYVTNFHQTFVKYDAAGDFKGTITHPGNFPRSVTVDRSTGNVLYDNYSFVVIANPNGVELTRVGTQSGAGSFGVAYDEGLMRLFIGISDNGTIEIFEAIDVPTALTGEASGVFRPDATLNGTVNDDGAGPATCEFEYGFDQSYGQTAPCSPGGPFDDGVDHEVSAQLTGLETETTYHFRIKATNAEGSNYGVDTTFSIPAIPELSTDDATSVEAHAAVLHGSFDPAGIDTRYYFEYGADSGYGTVAPALPGSLVAGTPEGNRDVSTAISGLVEAHTYHYRIVAVSSFGTSFGEDRTLTTPALPPEVTRQSVRDVHPDSAVLSATVRPGGAQTSYRFEYGLGDCGANPCTSIPIPDGDVLAQFGEDTVSQFVGGLEAGTTYHFRTIVENESGEDVGPDRTFTTFPQPDVIVDPCANAHVRQQTGAALLLDCRAYELVTATDTGGYNVESDLAPGQHPFGGYPAATGPSRALYAVNNGFVPGAGNPTNHGPDPYLATRGDDGWSTRYVGIPANLPLGGSPYGSPLLEASSDLSTFAFGGEDICEPCFDDGSTNVPLRRAEGELVKGIDGALDPGPAESAGTVRRHFSDDGSHFLFATTARVEPAGNSNGDVTVYERDLDSGATQVVSTLPDGATMTGPGIAALDISDDGSRVVIGKRVSSDSAGNTYWHPYLHVGTSANSIDLAPDAPSGVLYNGMNADGTAFYLATPDRLSADTDSSIDLYRVDVAGTTATPVRISTGAGGAGDTDSCDPVATPANVNWNSADAASDCSVAAIAGGGGIARDEGSIYFLSPELLDGPANGVEGAPNLYRAAPGQTPALVATLESELTGPAAEFGHEYLRSQGLLTNPQSVAVDDSNGDLYVLDLGTKTVRRFDSSGDPVPFSAARAYVQGNQLTGTPNGDFAFNSPTGEHQIAVDSSGGPTDGYVYVTDTNAPDGNGVVDVFDSTGEFRGRIAAIGFFAGNCGVAVGPDGDVYVASPTQAQKFSPVDGDPANNVAGGTIEFGSFCQVAVDSSGDLYGHVWFDDRGVKYDASSFSGADVSEQVATGVTSVAVDPATDDAYFTKNASVVQLDDSGALIGEFGSGKLAQASDAAIDTDGDVYVSEPAAATIMTFGPLRAQPDPLTQNPIVVNAVNSAETHRYGDFQVTPDGAHAAFGSTLAITGYDTDRHAEVYRYKAGDGEIRCVSCSPTGVTAIGDAALPADGLGLSDDGRVFFNSTDELTARDLNRRQDAYEWSDGKVELVSPGTSPHDSSLLGISADATDAFFFTREKLVDEDLNGGLMRIYDARAGGGFPRSPDPARCQASDECHGPGTEQPLPPQIGTFKGRLGNETPLKCKKGKVKRHGKCVSKKKRGKGKKHRKNRKGKRGGNRR